MMFCERRMPRYDTLDCKTNLAELDPCLAAEIRLKDKKKLNLKLVGICLAVLVVLLASVVLACLFLIPSDIVTKFESAQTIPLPNPIVTTVPSRMLPKVIRSQPTNARNITQLPPKTTTIEVTSIIQTPKTTFEPVTITDTLGIYTIDSSESKKRNLTSEPFLSIDTLNQIFETCDDYFANGFFQDGVYLLKKPDSYSFKAQCVMNEQDGKAWMVIQKRTGDQVKFWDRSFSEYSQGFGNINGDHWLGLKHIRDMIEAGHKLQLRMEIEGDRCGRAAHQDDYYFGTWNFEIDSEADGYRLHVSVAADLGNFKHPLTDITKSNGLQFNAKRENSVLCLDRVRAGGWWSYENGCSLISLNGQYTCDRPNSMYGLSVYRVRPIGKGKITTSYIRPESTRMMVRVCKDENNCL